MKGHALPCSITQIYLIYREKKKQKTDNGREKNGKTRRMEGPVIGTNSNELKNTRRMDGKMEGIKYRRTKGEWGMKGRTTHEKVRKWMKAGIKDRRKEGRKKQDMHWATSWDSDLIFHLGENIPQWLPEMSEPTVLRTSVNLRKRGSGGGSRRSRVNTGEVKTLRQTGSSKARERERDGGKTSGLVFRPVARKQALNNSHFDIQRRGEDTAHSCSHVLAKIVRSLQPCRPLWHTLSLSRAKQKPIKKAKGSHLNRHHARRKAWRDKREGFF